jgi:Cellulase (glycosyl hydrolase family 5)
MATNWLSIDPNHPTDPTHILLPDGSRFHGRGANIHDTRSCDACTTVSPPNVGEVLRRIDELVDAWGANFLRLVLESYAADGGFRKHWMGVLDDPGYLAELRAIVSHIGSKPDVRVLLSLWADPTFTPSQDLNRPPDPSKPEGGWPTSIPKAPGLHSTKDVWTRLASTFAIEPHVLFGVCNEPERNYDGTRDAEVWTAMNSVVDAIRAAEAAAGAPQQHVVAVQGTRNWARVLDYYVANPITAGGGTNIVYETHVYNPQSDFSALFEGPALSLPVIIGEFGPQLDPTLGPVMTLADCDALMASARVLEIPHLGWTFHHNCGPNMLIDNSGVPPGCGDGMPLAPTEWGMRMKAGLTIPW